jgi:hypothetical protein
MMGPARYSCGMGTGSALQSVRSCKTPSRFSCLLIHAAGAPMIAGMGNFLIQFIPEKQQGERGVPYHHTHLAGV